MRIDASSRSYSWRAGLAVLLVAGGCSSSAPPPSPSAIDLQAGPGSSFLPGGERLVLARVTDPGGIGIGGVDVAFVAIQGGGTVSPAMAKTDDAGSTGVVWTLGPEGGASQVLEARVAGLAPATLAVQAASLLYHGVGLSSAAGSGTTCSSSGQNFPIPGSGCDARLTELRLEIQGTVQILGMASARGVLRCANVEIRLDPLLEYKSTFKTVVWREGAPAVVSEEGVASGTASVIVHPDIAPGTVSLGAGACDPGPAGFGSITVEEMRLWGGSAFDPGAGPQVEAVSGDGQTGATGVPLAVPLVVRVVDDRGGPLAGQIVEFEVLDGAGTVTPSRATSSANGTVSATMTPGWTPGSVTSLARLVDPSTGFVHDLVAFQSTVEFKALLGILSGDAQVGAIDTPLAAPLVVRVTDVLGNPAAGIWVRFDGASGGGTVAPDLVQSGGDGTAQAIWTLGRATGPQAAVASIRDMHPWETARSVTFHATATADLPALCGRDIRDGSVTVLTGGRVLVVGGRDGCGLLSSTRIYDPLTDSWASGPPMAVPRGRHVAALLPSGEVLVAGGETWAGNSSGLTSTALLLRPVASEWVETGAMGAMPPRRTQLAALLPTAEVLVVGSVDAYLASTSAELYDPRTGTWRPTGSPATTSGAFSVTLLPSGMVLLAGGGVYGPGPDGVFHRSSSSETYDPATGTWTPTGSMAEARSSHMATLLPDGRVLVAGGENGADAVTSSAEIYDPATGVWAATGALVEARLSASAFLLSSGKVLVFGGRGSDRQVTRTAEIYDPATGSWSATGPLLSTTSLGGTALLEDGRVLSFSATSEIYDPRTGTWTSAAPIPVVRDTLP